MEYKELECKSALNKIKKPMLPYRYDLNIYRGCEHNCQYCFAMYTHRYLEEQDYFQTIYYKKNIASVLDKELSSPKWQGEVINMGGVTDSYQPIEKDLGLTREVLKVMLKHKNPIIISTKSNIIERDIDIIKELSKVACVNIACTITTMDEDIRKQLEPNGVSSRERFRVLKRIKEETNAIVGVHMMPIIPYLNSNTSNLREIYRLAKKIKADYVLPGTIYLKGETRNNFLSFLKKQDIQKYTLFQSIFTNSEKKKEFKQQFYQKIQQLEIEYKIDHNYQKVIHEKCAQIEQSHNSSSSKI